jgi:hypothetical protein
MIRGEIMINVNLDINLHSTVSLNSINYKSNQHQESFSYELDKIHPEMLQRDSVVMKAMKVVKMMVIMMMIPMKPSSMAVTMAMISLLREGISLADLCVPESFLSVCFLPWRGSGVYLLSPLPILDFRGDDICEGAMPEVDQGGHTTWRCGLGLTRARGWCGHLVAHLALSFWLLPSSDQIGTSGYFLIIHDLRKYCILTVLFQQNPDSGSEFSNNHQTCKNRRNNISIISKYEIYQ